MSLRDSSRAEKSGRRSAVLFFVFFSLVFGISLAARVCAQSKLKSQRNEQHDFSVEQEIVPIDKPAVLPSEALPVLAKEDGVTSCLQSNGLPAGRLPASWFVASQVHLGSPGETDFVLLPNLDPSLGHPGPAGCFLGPNTGQFWILRKTQHGYRLVLTVFAHDLAILPSRWNGLHEIEADIIRVSTSIRTVYRFDGSTYQLHRQRTIPNG